MRIIEFRIIMPMTVQEYQVGQLWSVAKASKAETGGGEGIEVVVNQPFDKYKNKPSPPLPKIDGRSFDTGQYTRKLYFLENKVPSWIRFLTPQGALDFEENAWNAFPYCRTVFKNPAYMGDQFFIRIETMHAQDNGCQKNIHNLPNELLEKREVVYIDIVNDDLCYQSDYKADTDPTIFQSKKTGRGPLRGRNWWKNTDMPIMCAYKLVTCEFVWWGLQDRGESMIMFQEQRVFLNFHRQLFCWIDQWHGFSMKDIRELEGKTKRELAEQRAGGDLRGTFGDK